VFVLELKPAKEILLLAEVVNAELAMQFGVVNRVVGDEELDAKVVRIASRIANLKAEMVVANKRLVSSRGERTGFRILRRFAWSCG
jgi:enoyl-CoA hydratase/carnithine racemase